MRKILNTLFVLTLLLAGAWTQIGAEDLPPTQTAETIRAALFEAQMNPDLTAEKLSAAENAYGGSFQTTIAEASPEADAAIRAGFEQLHAAPSAEQFAAARAQVWTSILNGSYQMVEQAVQANNLALAQAWLNVREFRTATRFSRPNADATLALGQLAAGSIKPEDALQSVHADLLDTYQARLNEALRELDDADQNGFTIRRAELAGLAAGYFEILTPAYAEQRGSQSLTDARRAFADLRSAALSDAPLGPAQTAVKAALENFRAAPLSPAEQSRRARQLILYLSLVPVEYERGVSNGQVTKQLEIQEALTFHAAAQAAFDDLRDQFQVQNPQSTQQAAQLLETLGKQVNDANTESAVTSPEEVHATVGQLTPLLKASMPTAWQQADSAGDLDVIDSMLDQMITAIRSGDYALAESARLEAYAVLESGPEARLSIVAPESKVIIEDLFWNGQGQNKGLAYLIKQNAPLSDIQASRATLDAELQSVQKILSTQSAPLALASNAAIIVFREGLEAVVILASLMSSMKAAESRKYRAPMWWGTGLALLVTVATWVLAQGILTSLARYGEKLEAIVSLIAVGVLLLITNWFFHKSYWTDWMTSFHSKKKRLISGETGLMVGLVSLGFTSVYREGFETVLFLQVLVLEGGLKLILAGVAVGFLATVLVGLVTFKLQTRLPYMNMLVVTGIMIGVVLLTMVGKTVHVMQVVGWMPTSLLTGASFPYWLGTWFGIYATWQGLAFQFAAAVFVIGSFYLAEGLKHTRSKKRADASKPLHGTSEPAA